MRNSARSLCSPAMAVMLALLAPADAAATAPPAVLDRALPMFRFQPSEIGNLVYQLDCLSSMETCAFEDLWKKRLGWTPADDEALAARKRLLGRYRGSQVIGDVGDDGPLLSDYPRILSIRRKVMRAGLGARNLGDYQQRLELVLLPDDAAEVVRLTSHFLPRFRLFFREARPWLQANVRAFETYLRRPDIRTSLQQIVTFFALPTPGQQRTDFPLLAIPREWKGRTSGEQFENQTLLEVEADEPPRLHFSIAMHEAFHFFYSTASADNVRKLVKAFAASSDPAAATAYGLLTEVLPSTLSAGLVQRALQPRAEWEKTRTVAGSYYQIPAVDRVAKAMVPWLEDRLRRGLDLYEASFVPGYVRLVRETLASDLDRPSLGRVVLAAYDDETLRPALDLVVREARPCRQEEATLDEPDIRQRLEKHPLQGAYLLVRADRLPGLRGWERALGPGVIAKLQALGRQHGAFVLGLRRPPFEGKRGIVYVFVGRQTADFEPLARRFIAAPAPFDLLTLSSTPPGQPPPRDR